MSTSIIRRLTGVRAVLRAAPTLAERAAGDPRLRPEYLFARGGRRARAPLVVVVRRGRTPIGLVYAIEELIAGLPSGTLVLADRCGTGLVLAEPAHRDAVLQAGLRRLANLARVHTLVVNYSRPGHGTGPRSAAQVESVPSALETLPIARMRVGDYSLPYRLPLAESWPAFLETLGPDTRRNMRRYPRRAAEAGVEYVGEVGAADFRAAFEALRPRSDRSDGTDPFIGLGDSADALRVGLRHPDTGWVSLMAGWRHGQHVFALTQLNDAGQPRASLSMVLRALMIEDLIGRGVRELVFLDGCAGALSLTCLPEPVRRALIDVRGPRGRLADVVLRTFWPRLADRLWERTLGEDCVYRADPPEDAAARRDPPL